MPSFVTHTWLSADLSRLDIGGDLTVEDVKELCAVMYAQAASRGYLLTLVDLSQMGTFPPDARRALHQEMGRRPSYPCCTAVVGASTSTRVLLNLTMHAFRLVQGPAADELQVFKTTEAALFWLADRRFRKLAKRA